MMCGSNFPCEISTHGVNTLCYDKTPLLYPVVRYCIVYDKLTGDMSLYHQRIPRFCPENGIANGCIHYRSDRVA